MSSLFKKPRPPADPADNAWQAMSVPCKNGHHADCGGHRYVNRNHRTGEPVYGRCGCLCHRTS